MRERIRCVLPLLTCLALILPLICSAACAQALDPARMEAIQKHVAATPRSATGSVRDLSGYLTKPAQNDLEKVRAIYTWIINNVDYDVAALMSGNLGDQSAQTVLKTRKGVCAGYSRLFEALAKEAGMEALEVDGFSKGAGYSVGQLQSEPDHAWSSVKVDGRWQLLDCTWAAGFINSQNQFVRKQCDYYFLTPPDEFVYDHLPEDAKWQLLDQPIGKDQYALMVYVRPAFFENKLKLISHTQGVIKSDCCFSMRFGAPRDVLMEAQVIKGEQKDEASSLLIQRDADALKLDTAFASPGSYTLRLFAKRKQETGLYAWAADYRVEVQPGTQTLPGFPKTYSTFHEKNVLLQSPMSGKLKSGETQAFKLTVPGAEAVSVVAGDQWTRLEKNGDTFQGSVAIKGDAVQVAARYPDSDSFYVLLKYAVSQ